MSIKTPKLLGCEVKNVHQEFLAQKGLNIVLVTTETQLSTPEWGFPLNATPNLPWLVLPTSPVQERSWKLVQWEGALVIQAAENKKQRWSLEEEAKAGEMAGSHRCISSLAYVSKKLTPAPQTCTVCFELS